MTAKSVVLRATRCGSLTSVAPSQHAGHAGQQGSSQGMELTRVIVGELDRSPVVQPDDEGSEGGLAELDDDLDERANGLDLDEAELLRITSSAKARRVMTLS